MRPGARRLTQSYPVATAFAHPPWQPDKSPQDGGSAANLDDAEAPLQQLFGFVRENIAHALGGRPFRVVVVNTADDLSGPLRLAYFVVGGA